MVTPSKTPSADRFFQEWPLALAGGTLVFAFLAHDLLVAAKDRPVVLAGVLVTLCGVILSAAVALVRHADELAHRLGEPAGTLLLTLAVTGLEVAMVGFVMSTGDPKPMLARDTMYAVVMLVMNGFMGLSLVLGGYRHQEQPYNLQSANAFLLLILPLTVLGLVLPNFTRATPGPMLSDFQMVFLSLMSVGVYSTFLWVQNQRHRGFFIVTDEAQIPGEPPAHSGMPNAYHAAMLLGYGLPLVLLAKQMAMPLDALVHQTGAPPAVSGLVMAILVLTPESIAAVRAALANRLQRSVNILLGSVLASIGLTIPLVIGVSLTTHRPLVLGLGPTDTVMLVLTLATSVLTFATSRTNILPGAVHLLLFGAYLMLLFDR